MAAMTTALGLMSGTSMDGIDVAALRTDGETIVERGPSLFVPYDDTFRARIEAALQTAKVIEQRDQRPHDLAELERDLTQRHAEAVHAFRAKFPDWQPELIGFHGQTVLHRPAEGLTVQIGDGALLAQRTGTPVVYNMRAADMVAGGQGAPLVPAYHVALAKSLPETFRRTPTVFVNIGGISNVTYVPASGDPVAFDSGPGNQLIDQWMQREGGLAFDADGVAAAKGSVHQAIVEAYLQLPFFARPAPKSLDRGDFDLSGVQGLNLNDGARTLAALAAEAVFAARKQMPETPKLWILCGGGRKNPHISGDLQRLAEADGGEVVAAEEVGLDGDATEAEAWAYLAVRSTRGLPLTWPTTTGCDRPVTGGVLAQP
ncbi:anhydro-N-acetylmuramic acid kinase [Tianweitania sp. BSSL-BM11]|uniref:Anhydro-N-acetylmuramic acid kinase n=1 Tax=Tianweitania aestuarii TaxID=2814886 RepID=A0ABS5RU76_9HYPH|nr:anhydro-N-acetylmuramic acid kinase [Tianweitania aestuarii]MBS9720609.1 anhydro-N-acetylmuramic acid kinase [Tianweitania aestuarii]